MRAFTKSWDFSKGTIDISINKEKSNRKMGQNTSRLLADKGTHVKRHSKLRLRYANSEHEEIEF